jgi:predicted ATPase
MNTFVVISGCSGGGKSTLLAELARRGYATVEEPGRRIVAEEIEAGGTALPWVDGEAFARRAIALAIADRAAAPDDGRPVFFDRGLIDAASALEAMTGEPVLRPLAEAHRYHARVFLTPPWPEIYQTDAERRHGMDAAIAEYERPAATILRLATRSTSCRRSGSRRGPTMCSTGSPPRSLAFRGTLPHEALLLHPAARDSAGLTWIKAGDRRSAMLVLGWARGRKPCPFLLTGRRSEAWGHCAPIDGSIGGGLVLSRFSPS